METEVIDKLYLELSQVTKAKTARRESRAARRLSDQQFLGKNLRGGPQ